MEMELLCIINHKIMIIIPDIHGRTFWKEAVQDHENEKIIFLGDYTDPYPDEDVEYWQGYQALAEVIAFKKEHINNVVLLWGNHDLSYINPHIPLCRHDEENFHEIRLLLRKHQHLFELVHEEKVGDRRVVFSHAGIHPEWLKENADTIGTLKSGEEAATLNQRFRKGEINKALGQLSWYRGGLYPAGSCVWADAEEFQDILPEDLLPDCYQVFGHTQQAAPLITERFACLDCRTAFELNSSMVFRPLKIE